MELELCDLIKIGVVKEFVVVFDEEVVVCVFFVMND